MIARNYNLLAERIKKELPDLYMFLAGCGLSTPTPEKVAFIAREETKVAGEMLERGIARRLGHGCTFEGEDLKGLATACATTLRQKSALAI